MRGRSSRSAWFVYRPVCQLMFSQFVLAAATHLSRRTRHSMQNAGGRMCMEPVDHSPKLVSSVPARQLCQPPVLFLRHDVPHVQPLQHTEAVSESVTAKMVRS